MDLISDIKERIRTRQLKNKEPYRFWYNLLGYIPEQIDLFNIALTHRSLANTIGKSQHKESNERLEYLGDAVISMVVADELYHAYPKKPEGFLTKARSAVVRRENLNQVARRIGIDNKIKKNAHLKDNANNVYGNAIEAIVGAIYLDRGYDAAATFVKKYIIVDRFQLKKIAEKETDFKSRLLEYGQMHRMQIDFQLLADRYESTDDSHTFVCQVLIDGTAVAEAAGKSKRIAQQMAAKKALRVVNSQKKQ